jgi:hypothetical protein
VWQFFVTSFAVKKVSEKNLATKPCNTNLPTGPLRQAIETSRQARAPPKGGGFSG